MAVAGTTFVRTREKAAPSREPRTRLGAKTPPGAPEPSVSAVARIFAPINTPQSRRPWPSCPEIAASTVP